MLKAHTTLLLLASVSILLSSCNESAVPLEDTTTDSIDEVSEQVTENTAVDFFGTLIAFDPSSGFMDMELRALAEEEGWTGIRSDENNYAQFLENLETGLNANLELAKELKFSTDREIVGAFVWNVIEFEKGTYEWTIPDALVEVEGEAGMSLSAVIQPFAAWDQDSVPQGCQAFDFLYYDYKADSPSDWEAYKAFLTATVDRYDGDGANDMPGLTTPVKTWEIGNEYDGTCGGDLNQAENLFELQKVSYETIKAADPEAKVLNAGALELSSTVTDIKGFWQDFFELGGGAYIDAFNMHYNRAKFGATEEVSEDFESTVTFFKELMEANGGLKPIWITEFGTYSGTPQSLPMPDGRRAGPSLPEQSEAFQAAWHFKESVFAIANGVEKIFIDFKGPDNTTIGGSAIYNEKSEARDFLSSLLLIEEKLEGYETAEMITAGQYLFTVGGKEIYALWDGTLPDGLTGSVTVTNYLGEVENMDASQIVISSDNPLFVEEDLSLPPQ